MAKIQRIGHDHQAPFLLLLLLGDLKRCYKGKQDPVKIDIRLPFLLAHMLVIMLPLKCFEVYFSQ